MYTKTIPLSSKNIHLYFTESPCFDNNCNSVVFGAPINFSNSSFKNCNFELGNTVKGYWVKIDFNYDSITITNDILGGYRLYYFQERENVFISDDYQYILKLIGNNIKKHDIEYLYWIKHRFTTGQSTFVENLKKISPASILEINNEEIIETSYFKDISRKSNCDKHKEFIHKDLLETFKNIKNNSEKNILLFSGGKDSCLLLQYMLHYKIAFTPVFFKLHPINKTGKEDIERVRAVARKLHLNLEEIEINISDFGETEKQEILSKQLFDKHFSLLHYSGYKIISKKFGKDCLIINGQSSDSILSFGPSENSLMSYFRRHIMYSSKSFVSKLGLALLILKTRKLFKLPKNEVNKLFALFDEYKYTRVIDCAVSENYKSYIKSYIKNKTKNISSYHAKEMYTKIISFSQGSDNQVVVNSSKCNHVKTLMPFATPNIIYKTIEFKDESLEIKKPKYVIENILEDYFSFYYNKLDLSSIDTSDLTYQSTIEIGEEINNLFINESERLFV